MKVDKALARFVALSAIAGNAALLTLATDSKAASASAGASATVVTPVTVTDLLFAKVSEGGLGGTITLSPAGAARNATAGPTAAFSGRGANGNASVLLQDAKLGALNLNVSGGGDNSYTVTLPPGMSIANASASDFALSGTPPAREGSAVVTGGNQALKVVVRIDAAEIQATAAQAGGFYITIDYN